MLIGHTMGTPEWSLPDALKLFSHLGLEGAEVIWQRGYACGLDPDIDASKLRDIALYARDLGVPVVALTPYEDRFNSLDDRTREDAISAYTRALAAAERLGCRWIRLYGGRYLTGEGQRDIRWNKLVESLRILGDRARDHGTIICVETHFNTMADTAENTASLIHAVDHAHVRVLYDQANLAFIGAEEWPQAMKRLSGLIAYVHVKDFVFTRTDRQFAASDVSHVEDEARIVRSRIVGEGILPWRDILRALDEIGYDGCLSLEYERRWHPQDLSPADEGMARSVERIRRWLKEFRSPSSRMS